MKLRQKLLFSSLVALLALGLGGCANDHATGPAHHSSHEPATAKVVKQDNHRKNSSANDQQVAPTSSATVPYQAATTMTVLAASHTQQPATIVSPAFNTEQPAVATNSRQSTVVPAYSRSTTTTTPAVTAPTKTQQPTNDNEVTELPDNYYYYWVWTDDQGWTHNVDWDLSDVATNTNGQLQFYDYAYEQQPNHATQYDSREFNLHYDGSNHWVFNFDSQIKATPDHGVVNRY